MIVTLVNLMPFFGVIAIGMLAARKNMFTDEGLSGINVLVFNIALPCLLFRVITTSPLSQETGDNSWLLTYLAAYIIPVWLLYFANYFIGRYFFSLNRSGSIIFTHLCVNGNVGFLGLPIAVALLGKDAALPTIAVLMLDITCVMALTNLLLEKEKAGSGYLRSLITAFASPILIAVFLGLAWRFLIAGPLSLELPSVLARLLDLLGQAAIPLALFNVGATLANKKADNRLLEVGYISVVKLLIFPVVIAFSIFFFASGTPVLWIAATVLAAAAPSSNNAAIFALNFGVYVQRASATVLISTALSFLSITLILYAIDYFS